MTNGQIAQLQELSKCWNLPCGAKRWIPEQLKIATWDAEDGTSTHLSDYLKWVLRRLTHQYRGQIAAMKRNRGKA
jgi:hypothetical protein